MPFRVAFIGNQIKSYLMKGALHKLIACFLLILIFAASSQKDDDPLDKLVNALHNWTDSLPQEKVYLHMDKPYYALGDTIWFKAYLITGSRHQLSAISGAIYVELINENDSVVNILKLPVIAGMSMGNITLQDDLKEGNYRIRAYTQWMRNVGADYFFDRIFTVVNPFEDSVISKSDKAILSQSDIQFFPESGNLVYGVASRLAFKAIGIDGNGLDIRGEVFDQDHQLVTDFKSRFAGIGSFLIKPEKGKAYTAKITLPDGSDKLVALPIPVDRGYVLSVFQPNADSILVRIAVPELMISNHTSSNINCIVHSGGEIISASQVKIDRTTTSFWLQRKSFPFGIAQFTLFSAEGKPLNERVAFIKTKDQLSVHLKTPKQIYKRKELVELEIESRDSKDQLTAGNFSVSVVDETMMPFDDSGASTIISDLLLTSDIKGYVEKPNYYFSEESDEVNRALDDLLLTQGYRRFLWSDVFNNTAASQKFKAEGLGTYISGRVLTLGNKPAENATVTLMALRANIIKGTSTDAAGRFRFEGMFLTDSIKFSKQARSKNKSNKVEVILDTVPQIDAAKSAKIRALNTDLYRSTKVYADHVRNEDKTIDISGGLSRTKRLKQVNIVAKGYQKTLPKQRNYNLNGPGNYDQIVKNEDLQTCKNLMACLNGKLSGIIFNGGLPVSTRASASISGEEEGAVLVVLDGVPLSSVQNSTTIQDIFLYNNPTPDQIATVEVLRSVNYTNKYGAAGVNGVILITTKNGGNHSPSYNPSLVNFSPKSFDKARTFYSPKYDRSGSNSDLPDIRSTIYWNPGVKTDRTGKTMLSFYTSNSPGTYKVTLEGIDTDGRLAHKVYRFSVADKD
ncbi:MAG: hypothetical protein EOO85_06180 [Pedobacter sp.]|nr:MAG: hypothetical protein EOO85_06180 [Pedobacter sp.]